MASKRTSKIRLPKKAISRSQFRELAQQATEAVQQQRAATQILAETLGAGRAAFPDDTPEARERRVRSTLASALEFGRVYLPHFFEQPSAPFHSALDNV